MCPNYLLPIKAELFYADTVHDRIESQIKDSLEDLKDGQSLLVEFLLNDRRIIIPTYIGFQNPSFIVVYGNDSDGNEIKALIPHTNVHVVITKLDKPAERNPIGFQSHRENDEI